MNELISIIVPCYNAEKTLDRCIKSVIEQTYRHWELIIIDDGSKDDSLNCIKKWRSIDNRIIFFSQNNAGVSAARNKAMEHAKGKYFAFLDADDWYESCFLEVLYNQIRNSHVKLACCAYRIDSPIDGHDVLCGTGDSIFYGNECLKQILFGVSVRGFMCNKLFDASIIKNIQFSKELRLCEDMYFLCEAYSETWSMVYVDKALYHYWINGTGATQSDSVLISNKGGIQALEAYRQMKKLFSGKKEQLYFVRLSGDTIVDMFQRNICEKKYNKGEIRRQIQEIVVPYFFTNASIKNKIKFGLILLKITKIWGKKK